MKQYLILSISIFLGLTGCASKRISSNYSEEQIKAFRNIGVVDPVLNLWELGSSEHSKAADLENPTRAHFRSSLSDFIKKTESRFYPLDELSPRDKDSMVATFDSAFFSKEIDAVKIPDNLLTITNEDVVLFLYFAGTYKTKERQRKEFWKSLGIGLATLGFMIPVYYPGTCELYSVLVDKKNRKVVYTDRVVAFDDFRKEKVMTKLLDKSINKFFAKN